MKYTEARELVEAAIEEMATPRVKKRLKDYANQSPYMREKRSAQRYPAGHQKKGISMKSPEVKELRATIDHHQNQSKIHSDLYNRSMDANHRAQMQAHARAAASAMDAHKKLTGKEYTGKKSKSKVASYTGTKAQDYHRQSDFNAIHKSPTDWHLASYYKK